MPAPPIIETSSTVETLLLIPPLPSAYASTLASAMNGWERRIRSDSARLTSVHRSPSCSARYRRITASLVVTCCLAAKRAARCQIVLPVLRKGGFTSMSMRLMRSPLQVTGSPLRLWDCAFVADAAASSSANVPCLREITRVVRAQAGSSLHSCCYRQHPPGWGYQSCPADRRLRHRPGKRRAHTTHRASTLER